ncbi:MAG: type I restriction enzyme HsdR N-terminal domain-containing protein, partial [Fervidobacterium sp.]
MEDKTKSILYKIIPSAETEIPLLSSHLSKLEIYEKSQGEWYVKSHDSYAKEKLVFDENKNQRRPEEIVRQFLLFELTDNYGYPIDKIKVEESVSFGREKKRADIVVYQNDGITPWIIGEVKEPNERLNMPQLKSYLNAEGSPIGVAANGKEVTILYRPYPKEFEDNLPDIPTYTEYSEVKDSANPAIAVSEIVLTRNWTLERLKEVNKQRKRPLRNIIETLEELVLANSGVDSFNEIFRLIYAKLYDEHEAPNRKDHQLYFRKYKDPQVTYTEISKLFKGATGEWKGIFEKTEEIKLKPDHLNICVGEMQEMELFGTDLR